MILVITNRHDQIVYDWIKAECERRGITCEKLYTEDFPQKIQVSLSPSLPYLEGKIKVDSHEIRVEEISGFFYYNPSGPIPHPDLDEAYYPYVYSQSLEAIEGLWRALSTKRWINPPHSIEHSWHRAFQIRLAATCGLQVPKTLITNRATDVQQFVRASGGEMIYKPMTRFALDENANGETEVAFVSVIREDELTDQLQNIQYAPCLFQEKIEADYDVTVYVIGNQVWATKIHSRNDLSTAEVDYRKSDGLFSYKYEPFLLPQAVQNGLIKMTGQLGLSMCNFDLLATKEGAYYFLDANPTEFWLKLEELTGFPLCTAIVDELTSQNTLAAHPYIQAQSTEFLPNTAALGYHTTW